MLLDFENHSPNISKSAWIAPDAWIIGDVELQDNVSVFFGAVLRGDIMPIRVGKNSNIQEHSMLHTSVGRGPCVVGSEVTVGHRAILHGCTVEDRALIGMGAIVLDDAVIGEESLVGAGSVVTENKKFPPRSLIIGSPGKVVRQLSDQDVKQILLNAASYVKKGQAYTALLP